VRLVVIEGGKHAIHWTHAGQINTALLGFPAADTPRSHHVDANAISATRDSLDGPGDHDQGIPATAGPTSCRAADQSRTSRRPGGRTRRQRLVFRAADPAAQVAITTLTMTRGKDISLHMKDGHV
jgi:hypothetical protein